MAGLVIYRAAGRVVFRGAVTVFRRCLMLGAALVLTACMNAVRWTPDTHTVRSGETLYSIAVRYDLDHRQLAVWNGLGNGTYIRQGQKLRLSPPPRGSGQPVVRKPAPQTFPAPRWHWPTAGRVAESFGASARTESGIRIAGREGQGIYAVADGEVVYAGDGLPSYGQMLIIEHNETWLSAYGFNRKLRVREGDRVKAQQHIADMGTTSAGAVQLHFEVRRNGQPVDPVRYLPKR
ncbi:MAG: peptidoglycan DD-metalloendopeptidase family protein [Gammaproteobacteria bacterium]|nr:peptidoglycan DD-metalloendopeptidase family protein [Gammaproteobacteria bacterium]NND54420.1 peptidoglycan DD-metalloendopeptidase family protein [Gammaproteobacteria bacterium]